MLFIRPRRWRNVVGVYLSWRLISWILDCIWFNIVHWLKITSILCIQSWMPILNIHLCEEATGQVPHCFYPEFRNFLFVFDFFSIDIWFVNICICVSLKTRQPGQWNFSYSASVSGFLPCYVILIWRVFDVSGTVLHFRFGILLSHKLFKKP